MITCASDPHSGPCALEERVNVSLTAPDNRRCPHETQGALTAAEKNNGFLPNFLRILANAPVVLETYLTVSAINARSFLSLDEREAVQITAAAVHGCGFCVAGHTAIATKKAEMAPSVIAALRGRMAVDAPRINAIARFTEAVIASRGAVSDGALATFKQAGFDDQAALEVVLGVSRHLVQFCQ